MATLVPGVQKDRDNQISISGLQPYTTSVSIDGISTLNARLNGPVEDLFPSVEAISEFKVSAINNSAEFAQASDITTTSKSGGNEFHGALFWFHQNRALNATDPFAPVNAATGKRDKPALIANSFGGALSGPIHETAPSSSSTTKEFDAPARPHCVRSSRRMHGAAGDLSSISTPLVNPFTGQPYPNNQIPVSPTSARALDLLFPVQNQGTGASVSDPNYIVNVPGDYSLNGFDVRGDHIFSENQKVFARYTHKDISRTGTNGSGNYNSLAGEYSRPIEVRNLAGSLNWIISSSLINEFRAGYSLSDFDNTYPLAGNGKQIIQQLGITNLPSSPPQGGLPYFGFNNGSITVSASPGLTNPIDNKTIAFGDNLTWTMGGTRSRQAWRFSISSSRTFPVTTRATTMVSTTSTPAFQA